MALGGALKGGIAPHPVPLPRKLALASLLLKSIHIRKRIWMGEGTPEITVRVIRGSLLPWGEGQDEGRFASFRAPHRRNNTASGSFGVIS